MAERVLPFKPTRLSVQLLLAFAVVLITAMAIFSYIIITEELRQVTQNKQLQARALAKNLAAVSGDLILSQDYASIEHMLQRATQFPGVLEIDITDSLGYHLGYIAKKPDKTFEIRYDLERTEHVSLEATREEETSDRLIVWEPVVLGEVIGIVKLTTDMAEVHAAEYRIWINNSLISIGILIITLFLITYTLRRPIRSIMKYTSFAAGMDNMTGSQVSVDRQSDELKSLGEALNQVSLRLHMQKKEIDQAMTELQRLASFPENNPNIVISINSAGELLYLNPHGRQMLNELGLSNPEQDFLKLFPPNHQQIVQQCLKDNTTMRALEVSYRNHTLLWTCSPVHGQDNVHCYAHDITEKRRAEEQVRMALIEKSIAEAANTAKSTFLANMSHEIRTPLTAIIGFSESLLDADQEMSERVDAIHTIIHAGKHLLQIINDILDLSKIEADKLELENVPLALFSLIKDVRSLAMLQADSKGILFNIQYHYPLPEEIHSDPLRLKQILLNLISNAIKFTDQGSVNLEVSYDTSDSKMHFIVTDTGIGISNDTLARLFMPFSQADTSTTRKFGGTGLGLHISRLLANKLGGEIVVSSTPGKGSCFKLIIAAGDASKDKLVMTEPKPASLHSTTTINDRKVAGNVLLVEDNENNQKLITHYLRKLGANVTIAENGAQALHMTEDTIYDLILMDMQMPIMDGIEATRQLRHRHYTAPIVSLTANAMQADIDRCLGAGSDAFLAKPIDIKQFNEIVRRYLPAEMTPSSLDSSNGTITSTLLATTPELRAFIESFVAKLPQLIDELQHAYQQQNWPVIEDKIHNLKGIGGSYGFPQLSKLASRIEFELIKKNYPGIAVHLAELGVLQQRIDQGQRA